MTRKWYVLALTGLILMPASAEAQRRTQQRSPARQPQAQRVNDYTYYNRWSLEPYAGAFRDAYDLSGVSTGYLVGGRIGYVIGPRWRLNANVGYNETRDVAYSPVPTGVQYDNKWVLTTAGAEFDVVPGRTSASVGVNAGAGWRRVDLNDDGAVPQPGQSLASTGFSAYEVVVPGVTLRHRLTSRAAVLLRFEDYMFDVFEGPTDHSLAVSLGLAFR